MTLNILVRGLQAMGKLSKRREIIIRKGLRGISENMKNVGNFMSRLQKVLHCADG
jgi:hypothetical protein